MTPSTVLECPSGDTVKVSVINTAFLKNVPTEPYVEPVIPGHERFAPMPCLVFLIETFTGEKVLFDLGMRKDWESLSTGAKSEIVHDEIGIDILGAVPDVLSDAGIALDDIKAVILSHHHWDHVGDLSLFPSTTKVIVGPGFVNEFTPGYPADPSATLLETDFRGKVYEEIDTSSSNCVDLGPFRGVDYFKDGSLYLFSAPGHSLGHIGALARTTSNPDTFVLMGADACHHNGEMRPSCFRHLPKSITPHPLGLQQTFETKALTKHFEVHQRQLDEPFYSMSTDSQFAAYHYDSKAGDETIKALQTMDGHANVFIVFAHDDSVPPLINMFPQSINHWKEKGWQDACRWSFVKDFKGLFVQ